MSTAKTTRHSAKRKQVKGSGSNGGSQQAAGGELHQIAGGAHPALTTNQGLVLSDNQNSLRANPRGPTPSVLFDAVAIILSDKGAKALSMEGAAIDFVRDTFGHLKAIAVDKGGQALLKTANVGQTRASWMSTTRTHLLLRPRRANGSGKSLFERWHKSNEKLRKNSTAEGNEERYA